MSVVDREALKKCVEALEMHLLTDPDSVMQPAVAAARSVLEGEAIDWCEEHRGAAWDERGLFCCWKPGLDEWEDTPCRMVRVVVVPIEEK